MPIERRTSARSAVTLLAAAALAASPAAAQLTLDGAVLFHQTLGGGIPNATAGALDRFGAALAAGDFDGDGRADLAIGAPGETVSDYVGTGQLTVVYGDSDGLDPATAVTFAIEDLDFGNPILDESFSHALAAADFDGDGYDDLAIGVPWRSDLAVAGSFASGMVVVLHGSATGLDVDHQQLLSQGADGLAGIAQADDHFGRALVAGDFNDDGRADLAIGIPQKDFGAVDDSGGVVVIYGSAVGLLALAGPELSQFWSQSNIGLDPADDDERFGDSLAVGDWNGDGITDLAIGTPRDEVVGAPAAGSVTVLYGSAADGLTATAAQRITKSGPVPGLVGPVDRFGASLAGADFDCDGIDDLAIGSPGDELDLGGVFAMLDGGAVVLLSGSANGIVTSEGRLLDRTDADDDPAPADFFGSALVAGNFDADACADLVVGVPGADPNAVESAGMAFVFAGHPGAVPSYVLAMSQDGPVPGSPEVADSFGFHLAAGDFDGNGADDLAVGLPDDSTGGQQDAGQVNVFHAEGPLLIDGFETGDTAAWSATVN